jgi:hypothetical protein
MILNEKKQLYEHKAAIPNGHVKHFVEYRSKEPYKTPSKAAISRIVSDGD